MISLNILPKWKAQTPDAEVYAVRVSKDATIFASGNSNGSVNLSSMATGRVSYTIVHSSDGFPVSGIRFNPASPRSFLTVSTDGLIKEWGTASPETTWVHREDGNELYALDFHSDGSKFATGGTDTHVRLYDEVTKKLVQLFARRKFDQITSKGHSDRVYSVRFHPSDPALLFSGGWDNTVQIWDLRSQAAVGCFPGPHICGDALDAHGQRVLAGSWRTHDQLQLFDIRTMSELRKARWSLAGDDKQCQLYIARFFPSGKHFFAGGSGVNQLKTFSMETFSSVGTALAFNSAVFSAAITEKADAMVVGTAKGEICLHELTEHEKSLVFLTSV
jgi:WD40 repeat protein